MKVIAIRDGFHEGKRVRAGTEFEVPAGSKARWFAPVDKVVPVVKPGKGGPVALSQHGKSATQNFVDAMKNLGDLAAGPFKVKDGDDLAK